jgi:polyisoprenoid-binding protein YceI
MTGKAGADTRNRQADRPPRKRHWWRWILAGVVLLAVLVVLAGVILVRHQPSAPPLTLPSGPAAAPADPVSGAWDAAAGSVAGFRVRESVLGMSGDITGRTDAVTGTLVIARGQVTRAVFRIDLASITVDGHTRPQFADSLDTKDHPTATVTLASPVALPSAFVSGTAVTVTATAYLTLRGMPHLVTFTISARRDGTALEATGSIPVTFSRWGITQPQGYGFGSVASHGTAEFLLVLHRDAHAALGSRKTG